MADQKRKHTGLWLTCAAALLLGILYAAVSVSVAAGLPRVLEYRRNRNSGGVTFSDYERMPQVSFTDNLALCAEPRPEMTERFGRVLPSLVNEHYFDVYQMTVRGSAVTEEHVKTGACAAVISDSAARRISLDGNVTGQTFSLWGKTFTIVGVYREPKNFWCRLAADGFDRVYVPHTCYEGYRELPVDTAAAPKGSYSEKALPLLGMKPTETDFYLENDIDVKHDMIAGFINLLASLIALVLIVAAVRIIAGMGRSAAQRLREAGQTAYLSGVLRQNRAYLVSRVLLAAALAAVPVALLLLFPPKLVIPPALIPYDDLFDIPYYLDAFTALVQQENAALATGNGYYQHLFAHTMLALVPLFLLLAALIVTIAAGLAKFRRKKEAAAA